VHIGGGNTGSSSCPSVTANETFFTGQIDEVEFFKQALSATDVLNIYNAGSAGKCKPNVALTNHGGRLANISTRLAVQAGDNVLIGGFIISGTEPKRVMVRAIGPSLSLSAALANPILQLYSHQTLLASNDNWVDAPNKQEIINSTIAPTNDLESAILTTLPAGNSAYTAVLRGAAGESGIGLVETYDLDNNADAALVNISTRGLVQSGDNVLIGGFIIVGSSAQNVLVRAVGPSLPVTNALTDPTLELHNGNGTAITFNDNWKDNQSADITATGIPPTQDAESAIVTTLTSGAYTAIVRGKDNSTGVGLVEIYNLH
jgi:hypothetical protein